MIILDAPLASAVSPFIGDSIIASLLGYSDPSWAVRNSATMVFSAAMLRVVDADKNASNTDRTSSQAITLTELFRRYPPLLKFLPAMMQHCLLDQDKHVHSQLFPILLLLSRTQPVALSGSSSVSQAYPDIIFGGLANKDHSIRAAAARSLGNVCSDEINNPSSSSTSILKRCATSLMERDCDVAKNWNQVDGILLAMKAILSSSNTKETTLQDVGVHHLFLQIVRLESTPMYPPSCISTVLDLLVQHTEESKERRELIPVCLEIAKHCRFEALAGGALLYASAAKSLISLLEPDLWKPCDSGVFEESILYLQSLLASELIDVRLTAVKSFKKTIYQNIDGILAQENDIITADQVLSKIATVLLHCIEVELKHGKSSQKSLGPHIPTVRRLSRCFLECFDGYQQLKPETVNSFVDSIQTIDATLWSTAMAMVEHEKLLRDEELLSNGETFLSGNAVELMSIQIASDLARGILVDTRVHVFSNVVCRLNDSQASWRSRFSAVKAITTSQILAVYRDFCDGGAILSEVIEMLQDSDPDVRSCAARTAQQVLRSKCKPEGDDVAWSALPLPTLRRLYAMIHETASNDEGVVVAMAEKLLQSVQASSRDLISTMLALDEELEQTRTAVDLSQLTNSSAARTIFEAEDPNPFSERILKDQLAIQALLRLPSCQAWMASLPTAQALVEELTKVLVLLQKRINAGGIIHDMSRYPGVFPVLHGLLGVVAASIYLGFGQDETTNEIQRKATSILEEASTTMHPDILSMIKCLAHVETGSMAAKSDLEHCLFLL